MLDGNRTIAKGYLFEGSMDNKTIAELMDERRQQDELITAIGCYWFNQYKAERDQWTFGNARIATVRRFLKELPITDIYDAIDIAFSVVPVWNDYDNKTYKYFCGICWNKIRAKNDE